MNTINNYFRNLTIEELKSCSLEINDFRVSGVITNCDTLNRIIKGYSEITNQIKSACINVVIDNILFELVYRTIIIYEKIKKLTPNQCVNIAKIAVSDVDWKLIVSKNQWRGFDLIECDSVELEAEHIFQIAYDERVHEYDCIFTYHYKLGKIDISEKINEILDYINSL